MSNPQNRRSRDQIDQKARVTEVFLDYAAGRKNQTEGKPGKRTDFSGSIRSKLSVVTRRLIHLRMSQDSVSWIAAQLYSSFGNFSSPVSKSGRARAMSSAVVPVVGKDFSEAS